MFKICLLLFSFYQISFAQNAKPVLNTSFKKSTLAKPQVMQKLVSPTKKLENNDNAESDTTFGATLAIRHSAQVEKPDAGVRNLHFTHELNPYITTENYKIDADMYYYNYYDNQALSDWESTQFDFVWIKPWLVGDYFSLTPQLIAVAPLFKKSSGDFQFALGGRLTAALKSSEVGAPNFIFKYGLQLIKMSQKNEAIKGSVNGVEDFILDVNGDKQYTTTARLRQRVHLGYMLTEKLMALIYFHFDSNLLFDNSFRNGFYHETFLEYAANNHFVINGGLSNGGGLFVGQYQEKDNLKFYSKDSAEYFLGLGFNF